MKRFILILIATFGNAAIAAESGPYVGAHLGYASTNAEAKEITMRGIRNNISTETKIFDLGEAGLAGGGFVGYQFGFEKTAFSIEFDYSRVSRVSDKAEITQFERLGAMDVMAGLRPEEPKVFSAELDSLLSFTGKFSYSVTDNATVFVRTGYTIGNFSFEHQSDSPGFDLRTKTRRMNPTAGQEPFIIGDVPDDKAGGFVLGVGIEIGLSDNLSLYSEYQHRSLSAMSVTNERGTGTGEDMFMDTKTSSFEPNINTFRTGLRYQF